MFLTFDWIFTLLLSYIILTLLFLFDLSHLCVQYVYISLSSHRIWCYWYTSVLIFCSSCRLWDQTWVADVKQLMVLAADRLMIYLCLYNYRVCKLCWQLSFDWNVNFYSHFFTVLFTLNTFIFLSSEESLPLCQCVCAVFLWILKLSRKK